VRTARNHATRDGIRMECGALAEFDADLRGQIEFISTEWVSQKSFPEMGFTLGTVRHALDPEIRTHVAIGPDGEVQGVTTWLPVHENGEIVGWTLDLMRRRPGGFRPVMDFLIAESAMVFKAEGYRTVSLSVAPLARRTQVTGQRTMLDRTLDLLSKLLEPTYGFRSLMDFKAKFHPEFKPVYLVYQGPVDLALISLAIGRAYLPNLEPRQAAMLLRGLRHHKPRKPQTV
jgi:phosphatidylglycerol lysyltransferase